MGEIEIWVGLMGLGLALIGLYWKTYTDLMVERQARKAATDSAARAEQAAGRAEAMAKAEAAKVDALEQAAGALRDQLKEMKRSADANAEQVTQLAKIAEAAGQHLALAKDLAANLRARVEILEQRPTAVVPDERLVALKKQELELRERAQGWSELKDLVAAYQAFTKKGKR